MTFRLQRKKDRVWWWVNDVPIVEDHPIPENLPDGPCAFGFVANPYGGAAPATLEKLEARKFGEHG